MMAMHDDDECESDAEVIDSKNLDDVKRAHAKQLIEQYFYQLTSGCGEANCSNEHCASNGNTEPLAPNQAAARALYLYKIDAKLCNSLAVCNQELKADKIELTATGIEMESSHR